jgi:hypothetical protein
MVKRTVAKTQPRQQPGWLQDYRPQRLSVAAWTEVRPFVVECAERLDLGDGPAALRTIRVLACLAAWAVRDGLPLEVEVVLDPDTVERFVSVGIAEDRCRATYRAVLRRVGPKVTAKAPWESRRAAVAHRQVAVPYSVEEIKWLSTDALVQPTPRRVRAARAVLALGAGAGLDGRWVARVWACDVTTAGGVVLVRVGEPSARVVPVLAGWEEEVLDLASSAGDEFLVGGRSTSRNRARALAASLIVGNGHPRFSASRLRSTWLVTHLTLGARLPVLVRAAGLQGVTVLSDLLPFVPALDEAEAREMLRGVR